MKKAAIFTVMTTAFVVLFYSVAQSSGMLNRDEKRGETQLSQAGSASGSGSTSTTSTTATGARSSGISETSTMGTTTGTTSQSVSTVPGSSGATQTLGNDTNFRTSTGIEIPASLGTINVRIHRIDSATSFMPSSANVLAEGQVTSIDRAGNKISVRDTRSGSVLSYSISDSNVFEGLSEGDSVHIYTMMDANPLR